MTEDFKLGELPLLHPDELAELERLAGHSLTNDEAHALLRKAKIEGAFNSWFSEKDQPRASRSGDTKSSGS
jgi:hypothetical protein